MEGELIEEWKKSRTRLSRGENSGEFIPTWQVGQEQPNPNATASFAQDGYSKNSLIYACIKEKATSFAALNPMVIRRDGTVVAQHRMVDLLNNPNSYQDGQDFAELLMTQFEAAGNAYVHMKTETPDRERARAFALYPVKELELIRPDYVTIEPGRTRETDTFVVTVGGQVTRLPRREVIHIHEPNLVNDFYGLSKIALLTREGAIDLSMSDFELSFFRNAGVPMGLLSVKGKTSEDDITRIKSRFRQAYNGLRKWFDLLVLNSDAATYTPMGIPQNQMEMDSTRFHVESRICSVFGVPGIIVGARYALQAPQPIEEAEHQFWAETMVPATMRFARVWQKFLLPLFATTRDAGATVTYDFSQVRALQEDRSRKLREVVRLVLTGGFTVNQALISVGLQPIGAGDFYVRNGNQVIVGLDGAMTPMSGGESGPNLDNPLEGAARLARPVSDMDTPEAIAAALSIFRRAEE